ncbi:MAG: PEP-CTERM sorting domain-containing protein [Opitutus sp.]
MPEPATYALWGSALLLGVAAYRRNRGRFVGASAAA